MQNFEELCRVAILNKCCVHPFGEATTEADLISRNFPVRVAHFLQERQE